MREDNLRDSAGIYEGLMDDVQALANIFIGNEEHAEFEMDGDYVPFLKLVAQYHFEPENATLYNKLSRKLNLVEKLLLDLRQQIDDNHKKALHLYRKR